jgi:O-6-methylguanine DNA methyltransferase
MNLPFRFEFRVPRRRLLVQVRHDGRALAGVELHGTRISLAPNPPQCELERRLDAALGRYFGGQRVEFRFRLTDGEATAFQREVWDALRGIPYGQTRTYGEIARALGKPRAARAVGGACGANPWPIIVPCHRVVAADGSLGGYSAGVEWKRLLLRIEGLTV